MGGLFGGGSSGSKTTYEQSPEQRQMYQAMFPLFQSLVGTAQGGQGLWNVPSMPTTPSPVLPTSDWMSNISPAVMAGIKQPYLEGEKQLMETLGAGGQLGSAGAGFSGAGAAGLGEYWSKASPLIGLQAWNMVAPEMQRYGQQQYTGELQQRAEQMQAYQAPYQLIPSFMGGLAPSFSQGLTTQPQNAFERYGMPLFNTMAMPFALLAGGGKLF